jgi:hypothetical protein
VKALTPALKELKDSEKDMRKQQFAMDTALQQFKQAQLSGDEAKSEKAQDKYRTAAIAFQNAKNKIIEDRNAAGLEGTKQEYTQKGAMDLQKLKGTQDMEIAGLKAAASALGNNQLDQKLNVQILTVAQKMMADKYGSTKYEAMLAGDPVKYQNILSNYLKQAEDYVLNRTITTTPPEFKAGVNPPSVPTDKSKLVKNTIYNTARGRARWDGKQFVAE